MDKIINVIMVRAAVLMPGGTIRFDIGREMSKKAIMQSLQENSEIFVVCQKNPELDDPEFNDLYEVGTIAKVSKVDKKNDDYLNVVLYGLQAAKLVSFVETTDDSANQALVQEIELKNNLSDLEKEAYRRDLLERIEMIFHRATEKEMRLFMHFQSIKSLEELINELVSKTNFDYKQKQEILQIDDVAKQAELLGTMLSNEITITKLRIGIAEKMQTSITEKQKQGLYREQIRVLKEELGEGEDTSSASEEYYKKLEKLEADDSVKEHIAKQIKRYAGMSNAMSESSMLQEYIETMLSLPWNHSKQEMRDLARVHEILEEDHYGMMKIKERIEEYLAVHLYHADNEAPILCLVGPPGTGKTSIAKSVARALNRNYERISLGGVRDEAEIRGHRKTYIGAMPGRIVTALKQAECNNPLILLDEIDKMGKDYRGDVSAAMLEVLDGAQNSKFRDHYVEQPVDLSHVLFMATANQLDTIPAPLLDRMEIIELNTYLEDEKMEIAKQYLLPKQLKAHGLTKKQLTITKTAIKTIIRDYTRESGVRNLNRQIQTICRKVVKQQYKNIDTCKIRVTGKNVNEYLGVEKYTEKTLSKRAVVGMVHGLAWTRVGGDTLDIEVITLKGKGKISFTGNMGDVMKESAQLAVLTVRAICEKEGISEDYFETHDIHLHIPEGAVPKDGPSAGITMATAIYSAVTNKPVVSDLAMTGELSLLGHVLAIGGLREKITAAKARKIKKVLVPKENEKDILNLDTFIKDGIEIKYVSELSEVLREAIVQ